MFASSASSHAEPTPMRPGEMHPRERSRLFYGSSPASVDCHDPPFERRAVILLASSFIRQEVKFLIASSPGLAGLMLGDYSRAKMTSVGTHTYHSEVQKQLFITNGRPKAQYTNSRSNIASRRTARRTVRRSRRCPAHGRSTKIIYNNEAELMKSAHLNLLCTFIMGSMASKLENYRVAFSIAPPKNPGFTVDDVPDLTGRVALVTGGNRGCGFITAKVRCTI